MAKLVDALLKINSTLRKIAFLLEQMQEEKK